MSLNTHTPCRQYYVIVLWEHFVTCYKLWLFLDGCEFNYWVRDPALYYSAIHALKPKSPFLKSFKNCIHKYNAVQLFATLEKGKNCKFLLLWFKDKSEARVQPSRATLWQIGSNTKRHFWKRPTAAATRWLRTVIGDAAPLPNILFPSFFFF